MYFLGVAGKRVKLKRWHTGPYTKFSGARLEIERISMVR
jgi:hypothetical protein